MDEYNIATIFAPSVFKQTATSTADMIIDMKMQSQFLTNLLRDMEFPDWGLPDDDDEKDDEAGTGSAHSIPPRRSLLISFLAGKSLLDEVTDLLDDEIKELQRHKQLQHEKEQLLAER